MRSDKVPPVNRIVAEQNVLLWFVVSNFVRCEKIGTLTVTKEAGRLTPGQAQTYCSRRRLDIR